MTGALCMSMSIVECMSIVCMSIVLAAKALAKCVDTKAVVTTLCSRRRCYFANDNRPSGTLTGGEAQRYGAIADHLFGQEVQQTACGGAP